MLVLYRKMIAEEQFVDDIADAELKGPVHVRTVSVR